ncbi:MAG: hypothetical protein KDI90_01165 [Alphaproteobacteria bacterium]|nr:hypothetical protein [Alphaproteobacteria bacterium]
MHINGILGEKGFAAIERADAFRSGQKQKVILVIAADRGVAKIHQWGGDRLKLVGEDVPDSGVQGEHANKGVRRVVNATSTQTFFDLLGPERVLDQTPLN